MTIILDKKNTFTNDIIFIDGLWGTGKSILGPIVSGMDRVEGYRLESIYEYIGALYRLDKITKDGAIWMLRTYVDHGQYCNSIGREVNLRWWDDSGFRNSPNKLKIIKRLFCREGNSEIDEVNAKNLAYSVMSHNLMLTPDLLPLAYGKRLKVIEMVRHPLYMIKHFAAYLARFESLREFTMAFYYEETKVPWFVKDWSAKFVRGNPMERAVLCVTRLYPWLDAELTKARTSGMAVLDLSFEEAVFEVDSTLKKLSLFTGRSHNPRIAVILKRQMLPREAIFKGTGHGTYGWTKSDKSEGEMYAELLANVQVTCSEEFQNDLNKTIAWYNEKYPSPLSQYHIIDHS